MADKITIILEDYRGAVGGNEESSFKVQSVINSTDYRIGSWMSETLANDLCRINHITVKIVGRKN